MINCVSPPATTPRAMPRTGSSSDGASNSAETIMQTLKNTGPRAGAAKALRELRIPMVKAARLMKIRYGNMIRVRVVVRFNRSASS